VVAVNSTMDIAVAREVLSSLCTSCELLGIEQEGVKRWRKMLAKLPDYMINKEGIVKEWSDPRFEDNYGHRHLSHLYPVFPGMEITAERKPELMEAFRKALDRKVAMGGSVSWSYAQIASLRARMEDASGAYDSLEAIARGYILPNFFTLLQHGRPLLQFEASSAIPAAMVEMLVVSEPGMIKLLPALPKEWPVGEAEGLACRGGVEVSLKWNMNEKRVDATLISRTAQKLTVKFPAPLASLEIDSAEAKVAASPYGDAYRLLTLPAGKKVVMKFTLK
jgi:alpha-L-fucosidase 2